MANPVVEGFLKGKSLGVKGTAITVDMMPSAHAVVGYDVVPMVATWHWV